MSKQELIETIRRLNPTAESEFLTGFEAEALENYLDRLRQISRPRDGASIRFRGGVMAPIY